ncbi:MAG: hypothetical protein HKM04_05810 [Legionellales bacterium]|nr:hypothetical protein [Legionellales bacterium]
MRLIKQLKNILGDLRLSDVYPITHLNNRAVFEASNGMIGSTIRLDGVPFDTETNELMNQFRREWKNTIRGLSDSISLHVTIHREAVNPILGGTFPNEFTRRLNTRYEEKFAHTHLYKNTLYLTLIYKGVTSGKSGWLINKVKRLSEKTVKQARAMIRAHQMESLEKVRAQMLSSLAKFKPVLLGSRDEEVGYSELLEFLGLAINGGKSAPFRFPKATLPISESIATMKKAFSKYPTGNIGQYLFRYRLFFGKAIQFQGADSRFAAMLSIKDYPHDTSSLIFDCLLNLEAEFIATHTFSVEARDVSLKLVEKQTKQLESVDDAGKSQIEQLAELLDAIASRQDVLGYHHHSLMIFADTIQELDKAVNNAIGQYKDEGITAIREDVGQEAAFFAQIPTNLKYIARSVLISGDNFTDFCPFHNYRLGYRDGNHLGSAVTLLETAAKTPYFFNYHLPSANKSLTAGHAMVLGITGSGKTALMTWLDAQASRYNGFTFIFDVKRGFDFYIRACGGYYAVLSPDDKSVRFNPFQLPDVSTNREFCKKWLIQLVKEKEEDHIDVETQELLGDCVN